MGIHPFPHGYVEHGDTTNLIERPDLVQRAQLGGLFLGIVNAQDLQIPTLEDEGKSLGKGIVGHTTQHVVIYIIK